MSGTTGSGGWTRYVKSKEGEGRLHATGVRQNKTLKEIERKDTTDAYSNDAVTREGLYVVRSEQIKNIEKIKSTLKKNLQYQDFTTTITPTTDGKQFTKLLGTFVSGGLSKGQVRSNKITPESITVFLEYAIALDQDNVSARALKVCLIQMRGSSKPTSWQYPDGETDGIVYAMRDPLRTTEFNTLSKSNITATTYPDRFTSKTMMAFKENMLQMTLKKNPTSSEWEIDFGDIYLYTCIGGGSAAPGVVVVFGRFEYTS